MRPVLADLFEVALLLVRMLLTGETVEFIQFDVLSRNACDDFLVGGSGLRTGAINPSLNSSWMNAFDAGNSFRASAFKALLNGSLDFLFRSLEVIKGCAVAVAKGFPAISAADYINGLAAPDRIVTVVS